MKKSLIFLCLICTLLLLSACSRQDSPYTTSELSKADDRSVTVAESKSQNPSRENTEAWQDFVQIYTYPTDLSGDKVYLTPGKAFQEELLTQSAKQDEKQEPDTEETGIVPFSSEDIENIEKAELVYRDNKSHEIDYYERIYSPESLEIPENTLCNITHYGDSSCPFYEFFLNIETSDDSRMTLAMASDSCNAYFVNGRYFNYESSTGNQVFYTLFPHAPINRPDFPTPKENRPKEKIKTTSLAEMPDFTQEEIKNALICVEEKFRDFKGADMSLQLGSPYDDFKWILVREDEAAPWEADTWGY